jgi:hypothetical protein
MKTDKTMAKTSIQDLLLEEVKELRKDAQESRTLLIEVATTLKDVKEQTLKTNGRTSRLEERVNIHRGGIYVAYLVITLIIGVLTFIK